MEERKVKQRSSSPSAETKESGLQEAALSLAEKEDESRGGAAVDAERHLQYKRQPARHILVSRHSCLPQDQGRKAGQQGLEEEDKCLAQRQAGLHQRRDCQRATLVGLKSNISVPQIKSWRAVISAFPSHFPISLLT